MEGQKILPLSVNQVRGRDVVVGEGRPIVTTPRVLLGEPSPIMQVVVVLKSASETRHVPVPLRSSGRHPSANKARRSSIHS